MPQHVCVCLCMVHVFVDTGRENLAATVPTSMINDIAEASLGDLR
jgi:hypothetical protein